LLGGIYIVGNASIVAQLDGSGNQQFVITPSATPTTSTRFTFDLENNQTIQEVVASGTVTSTKHLVGVGTGVIYCAGSTTSLSGEIADNYYTQGSDPHIITRSAYTIATDINNKSITITNNLTYHTQPDATQASTALPNLKAGTLGVMARNIIVGSSAPSSLTINGVMMAGSSNTSDGSLLVSGFNPTYNASPKGTLNLLGGIIQKVVGLLGGSSSTGYAKNYYFDPRMATTPPPYFPTTGKYDQLSWARVTD
jgi:hypothetical protein